MSQGRSKPILADVTGQDIQDFLDSDTLRKLGTLDNAVLFMLIEIRDQLSKTNELLTQSLGEEVDDVS